MMFKAEAKPVCVWVFACALSALHECVCVCVWASRQACWMWLQKLFAVLFSEQFPLSSKTDILLCLRVKFAQLLGPTDRPTDRQTDRRTDGRADGRMGQRSKWLTASCLASCPAPRSAICCPNPLTVSEWRNWDCFAYASWMYFSS